ncbi:MAG: DUF2239 family protein [Pseudohongiellaceae bacterium]
MSELAYAFSANRLISEGTVSEVKGQIENLIDRQNILVFDQKTGSQIHLEFSESNTGQPSIDVNVGEQVSKAKRGRPKLGVVGREITLLPRHWEWLDSQRGGASATLRRLVDLQRAENESKDRVRVAQDSTNRFLYALAGNLGNFEEAVRALYSRNERVFGESIAAWPADIRKCAIQYADAVWE